MKIQTRGEVIEYVKNLKIETGELKTIIFQLLKEWNAATEEKRWDDADVIDLSREIYENRLRTIKKELELIELAFKKGEVCGNC